MSSNRRGRASGFRMSDEHLVKIANSNVLNALVEHAEGRREMSATQVTAAIALLKKVMPDLKAIQHSGDPEAPIQYIIADRPLTVDEWKNKHSVGTAEVEAQQPVLAISNDGHNND